MKTISLDLVRVTEAGAIHASKWIGSGKKEEADKEASQAMRDRFNKMDFCGVVKIGEGKKDESFGLFEGENVGLGAEKFHPVTVDIAIDPIEGTTPTVEGGPEAMSVIAIAGKDCMYTTKEYYMDKLIWGPKTNKLMGCLKPSLNDKVEEMVEKLCHALNKPPDRLTICLLKRVRNYNRIDRLRELGVRLKLIDNCDVTGGVAACMVDSGIDCYLGIGGAPEAIITAAAVKCLKGGMEVREIIKKDEHWWPPKDNTILGIDDLVSGPCAFSATGITDGNILRGVRLVRNRYTTHSMFMRSESGTIRYLETEHGN